MNKKKLQEQKEVKKWLIGKPEGTKRNYLTALKQYCDYRNLNPTQLLDEIEEDRKKDRRERGKVEYEIKKFYLWLLEEKEILTTRGKVTGEKGVSPKSADMKVGAIRGFYRANGFPIIMKVPKALPKKENTKLRLTPETVKKLVDHAPTLRDKTVLLFHLQSGMDVSTLCSLNYGDVVKGLKNDECPLPINVRRKKENVDYTTFVAKDSIEALKAYLNKRRKKEKSIKIDDPLFVKEKNYNGKPRITENLIQKMLREVAVLSGVVTEEEMEKSDMNPCRPHALRSAFKTIMTLQGVSKEVTEYWMGHTLPYEGAYFLPPLEKLKKLYAEHEESLSINRATEQVKKLEQKFDGKIETYDELIKRQASKIQDLEKELAKLEQSKEKQLGDELIKALEKHPDMAKKLTELLIKKALAENSDLAMNFWKNTP